MDKVDKTIVTFGKRVRELRQEKGLSQEAFADLTGLDRSYMGRVERGEVNITLKNISRIAEALSASIPILFVEQFKRRSKS